MKVWVLEKFETREAMEEMLVRFKDICAYAKAQPDTTEETIRECESVVANHAKAIEENPNGKWYGFEGKFMYRDFCYTAKQALRRVLAEKPDTKFRVVEGEIPDGSKYWLGYKVVKVNDGVMRYLMATK